MKLLLIFLTISTMNAQTIVNFNENPSAENWYVVDDVVMGGRSSGKFEITNKDHGKFYGEVSLENNGGFSSVRYDMKSIAVSPDSKIRLRLKGDGNTFQFRIKANKQDYYSYIKEFNTSGDWENLEFVLRELYPTFRGRRLELPNFDKNTIEEIRFLIGNKKEQMFQLVIESIEIL